MRKTIYIAGKVTGLPEEQVKAKFEMKEAELKAQGYLVVNPVERIIHYGAQDLKWEEIMKECIVMMMECDELHLLPCWQESKGAVVERNLALGLGMEIVYC